MTMQVEGDTLRVGDVEELSAANAELFRESVLDAFVGSQQTVEVDLSDTLFIDSCGVGTLISLNRVCGSRKGKLLLRNPSPAVEQLLELTRAHRMLAIAKDAA